MSKQTQPIAVFDSGVGGISVLRELKKILFCRENSIKNSFLVKVSTVEISTQKRVFHPIRRFPHNGVFHTFNRFFHRKSRFSMAFRAIFLKQFLKTDIFPQVVEKSC